MTLNCNPLKCNAAPDAVNGVVMVLFGIAQRFLDCLVQFNRWNFEMIAPMLVDLCRWRIGEPLL
jgi:hypothetical protein